MPTCKAVRPIKRACRPALAAVLCLALAFSGPGPALAAAWTMTYQGQLRKSGIPVKGVRSVAFKIYNSLEGGSPIWTSPTSQVAFKNGVFFSTFSPSGFDWETATPYLEVVVDGSALSPREELNAMPYALNALQLGGKKYTNSDSAPSSPSRGDLWLDTTVNQLRFWSGSAWLSMGAGAASVIANAAQISGDGTALFPLTLVSSSVTLQGNDVNVPGGLAKLNSSGDLQIGAASASTYSASGFVTLANLSADPADSEGRLYYNADTDRLRLNAGSGWVDLATGTVDTDSLVRRDGDFMSGPLLMMDAGLSLFGDSGNIGVGTAADTDRLTVEDGWLKFNTPVTGIKWQDGSFSTTAVQAGGGGGGGGIGGGGAAGRIAKFDTGLSVANSVMAESSGKVGVGTLSPGAVLDVDGDAQFGSGAVKSTFTASGGLTLASGAGVAFSGGGKATGLPSPTAGSDAATKAYVDSQVVGGSGWTDDGAVVRLTSASDNVVVQSTLTVRGSAFSVEASTVAVAGGRLGVGTTSPADAIHVLAASAGAASRLRLVAAGDQDAGAAYQNSQRQWFAGIGAAQGGKFLITDQTAGLERLAIATSGNVGIATTSPQARLDVEGSAQFGSGAAKSTFSATGALAFPAGYSPSSGQEAATKAYVDGQVVGGSGWTDDGAVVRLTSPSDTALVQSALTVQGNSFSVGGSTLVASGGRIGIGTTGPSERLDVSSNDPSSASRIRVASAFDVDAGALYQNASRSWFSGIAASGAGRFFITDQTLGQPRLAVDLGGNIGIGTTEPAARLDVVGGAQFGSGTSKSTFSAAGVLTFPSGYAPAAALDAATKGYVDSQVTSGSGWTDDGAVVRLTSASDNTVVQSTLTVQGNAFSVGGSTFVVKNGQVGIGTPNLGVGVGLSVQGDVRVGLGQANFVQFWDSQYKIGAQTGLEYHTAAADIHRWLVGGSERMRLDGSGNLGIGTVSPATKLDVAGGAQFGSGTSKSTFSAAGVLTFPSGYAPAAALDAATKGYVDSLTASSGGGWTDDGSVVRLTAPSDNVVVQSTLTVRGEAFSVGGSTLAVKDGMVGVGTSSPGAGAAGPAELEIVDSRSDGGGQEIIIQTNNAFPNNVTMLLNDNSGSPTGSGDFLFQDHGTLAAKFLMSRDSDGGIFDFQDRIDPSAPSRLRIRGNGYVGIGTTSPDNTLSIINNLNATVKVSTGTSFATLQVLGDFARVVLADRRTGGRRFDIGSGDRAVGLFSITDQDAISTRLAINSSGDVGVGTTAPAARLDVEGGAQFGSGATKSTFSAAGVLTFPSGYAPAAALDAATKGYVDSLTASSGGGWTDDGSVVRLTAPSDNVVVQSTLTVRGEAFSVGGSTLAVKDGMVGVGTTNPGSKMHVVDAVVGANTRLTLENAAGSGFPGVQFKLPTETWTIQTQGNDSDKLYVVNDAGVAAAIDTSGKVGIGTASPAQKLEVNGTIRTASIEGAPGGQLTVNPNGDDTNVLFNVNGGGPLLFIDAAGVPANGNNPFVRIGGAPSGTYEIGAFSQGGDGLLGIAPRGGNRGSTIEMLGNSAGAGGGNHVATIRAIYNSAGTNAELASLRVYRDAGDGENEGAVTLWTTKSGTPAERLHVNKDGNVGINTTSPAAKLHVSSGTLLIDGDAATSFQIGASTLAVTSSGLVGIGTTSPSQRLEVVGGKIQVTNNEFKSLANGVDVRMGAESFQGGQGAVGTLSNHPFDLYANGARVLRAAGDGKVGVGAIEPKARLQIEDGGSKLLLVEMIDGTGKAWAGIRGARQGAADYNSYLGFFTAGGAVGSNADVSVEKVRIDKDGNVGVGTTQPAEKLVIENGWLKFNTALTGVKWQDGSTSTTAASGGGGGGMSGTGTSGRIAKFTGASNLGDSVMAESGGNVGVGITNPARPLHVAGSNQLLRLGNGVGDIVVESHHLGGMGELLGAQNAGPGVGRAWLGSGGGDNRLYVHGDGSVTIGTASPAAKLHVSSGTVLIDGDASTAFKIGVSSFIVNSEARVGIGMTNPTTQLEIVNPAGGSARLHLHGSSNKAVFTAIRDGAIANGDFIMTLDGLGPDSVGAQIAYGEMNVLATDITAGSAGGAVTFKTRQSGVFTEAMRIDQAGRVGLGTTNPVASLHLEADGPTARLQTTGTANPGVNLHDSAGTLKMSYGYSPTLDVGFIGYGGNAHLAINSGGNVGIGTTGPATKLDVSGDAQFGSGTAKSTFSATGRLTFPTGYAPAAALEAATKGYVDSLLPASGGGWTDDGAVVRLSDGTDKVGVGTTSPAGKLHVSSGTVLIDGDASTAFRIGVSSVIIDSEGRIGVGTTAPTARLTMVNQNASPEATIDNASFANFFTESGGRLTVRDVDNDIEVGFGVTGNDRAFLGTLSVHPIEFRVNNNPGLSTWINTAGNVGIKTASPGSPNGFENVLQIGDGATTGSALRFLENSNANGFEIGVDGGLTVWEGTNQRLALAAGGNFGINQSNPQSKLHLSSGTFLLDGDAPTAFRVGVSTFIISSSGNVGIGTSNPSGPLDVYGANSLLETRIWNGSAAGIARTWYLTDTGAPGKSWSAGIRGDMGNGFCLESNSGGQWACRMFLMQDGKIGIGTTQPATKLDVNGDAQFGSGATKSTFSATGALTFPSGYAPAAALDAATKGYVDAATASSGGGWTDDGAVVRLTALNDDVGIGLTNPAAKVHAAGTGTRGLIVESSDNAGTAFADLNSLRTYRLSSTAGGLFHISDESSGQYRVTVNSSGDVGVGTTDPGNYKLNVAGQLFARAGYTAWIADGLFGATALPSRIDTPGGRNILFGYIDDGVGSYSPRIGFQQPTQGNVVAAKASIGLEINGKLSIGAGASNATAVTIDAAGNVGVGTTEPGAILTVRRPSTQTLANIQTAVSNNAVAVAADDNAGLDYFPGLMWYSHNNNPTKPKAGIWSGVGDLGAYIYLGTSGSYVDGITNTAIAIDPSGNVGIGTTSPNARLTVRSAGTQAFPRLVNVDALAPGSGGAIFQTYSSDGATMTGQYGIGGIDADDTYFPITTLVGGSLVETVRVQGGRMAVGSPAAAALPANTLDVEGGAAVGAAYAGASAAPANGLVVEGSVGVGTTEPAAKLDVNGGAQFGSGAAKSTFSVTGRLTFPVGYSPAVALDAATKGYVDAATSSSGGGWTDDGPVVRLSAAGDSVGIGTTNPLEKLVVHGAGTLRADFQSTDVGGTHVRIISAAGAGSIGAVTNDPFTLFTNNTEKFRITPSGNVGIGVINPDTFRLEVDAGANDKAAAFVSDAAMVQLLLGDATTDRRIQNAAGVLRFVNGNTGAVQVAIDASGNMGVGTTNPAARLNVSYSGGGTPFEVNGEDNSTGLMARFRRPNAAEADLVLGTVSNADAYVASEANLHLATSQSGQGLGTPRLSILNGGNVGIGTTSPAAKLDVNGDAQFGNTGTKSVFSAAGRLAFPAGYSPAAALEAATKAYVDSQATSGSGWTRDAGNGEVELTNSGDKVGIGANAPATRLDVNGNAQFGSGAAKSTFTATGALLLASGADLTLSGGGRVTGLPAPAGASDAATKSYVDVQATSASGWTRDSANSELELTNSGDKVGIGTTAPAAKLDVSGDAQFGSAGTKSAFSAAGALSLASGASITVSGGGKLTGLPNPTAGSDAASKSYVDSQLSGGSGWTRDSANGEVELTNSGDKVGVGTTSPAAKLQVAGGDVLVGNGRFYRGLNSAGTQQPLIRSQGLANNQVAYPGVHIGQTNDHIALFVDPGSIVGGNFSGAANELLLPNHVRLLQANAGLTNWLNPTMTLDNGNVGIGTTRPDQMPTAAALPGKTLQIDEGATSPANVAIVGDDPALHFFNRGDSVNARWTRATLVGDDLIFASINDNGTVRNDNILVVDGAGNVGVGTTGPIDRLHAVVNDAVNSSLSDVLRLSHMTTGAAGNGIGAGLVFETENAAGAAKVAGRVNGLLTDATSGSEKGALSFSVNTGVATAEAVRIINTGLVGVGTTSPQNALHIYKPGGTDFAKISFQNNVNTVQHLELGMQSALGGLTVRDVTAGVDLFHIQPNAYGGNIGINTTAPNLTGVNSSHRVLSILGNSPTHRGIIELAKPGTAGGTTGELGSVAFAGLNGGSAAVGRAEIMASLDGAINSTNMTFHTQNAGTLGERVRINYQGNVGIGTTNPSVRFQVTESGAFAGIVSARTDAYVSGEREVAYFGGWGAKSDGALDDMTAMVARQTGSETADLTFWTSGTGQGRSERMRIASNGNVGIGTTAPGSGYPSADTVLALSGHAANGNGVITMNDPNPTTGDALGMLDFLGAGNVDARIAAGYEGAFVTHLRFETHNGAGRGEKVRITGSGLVGIGLTNPANTLSLNGSMTLNENGVSLGQLGNFNAPAAAFGAGREIQVRGDDARIAFSQGFANGAIFAIAARGPGGAGRFDIMGQQGGGGPGLTLASFLTGGGIGMGTTDPKTRVTVVGEGGSPSTGGEPNDFPSNQVALYAVAAPGASGRPVLAVHRNNGGTGNSETLVAFYTGAAAATTKIGSITENNGTVSYNAFTGSHIGRMEEGAEPGMLVSMTGSNERLNGRESGEAIYGLALTGSRNDPAVLGVYAGRYEAAGHEHLHLVNSVGNSDLWVVDGGEDIRPGDYLVASDVPGYAVKDPGFEVSHVVARAAELVAWDEVTDEISGRKRRKISVLLVNFPLARPGAPGPAAERDGSTAGR